jgi:hypothetical protein
MKKIYACLLMMCFAVPVFAQVYFQKTYGIGEGRGMQVTSDHGFIIVGYAEGITTGINLVKTDSMGVVQWACFYNWSSSSLYGFSVRQTNDGGYIITGTVITPSDGDVILLKTTSNGTQQWKKLIEMGGGIEYGFSVEQTRDSGFVVTGYAGADVILFKTDKDGTLQWSKKIGLTQSQQGKNVKQTSDDGFIITGFTTFGAGNHDVYLVKTDAGGNLQWTKTIGGINDDYGSAVLQTADHGYVVAGTTWSYGAGQSDVYLVKTDSAGSLQWTKTFGGNLNEEGFDVQQTSDRGLVISGTTNTFGLGSYDAYLLKTDSTGALQWSRTFGGQNDEVAYAAAQTADNGFVAVGYISSSSSMSPSAIYLAKTSANGNGECNTTSPVSSVGFGGAEGSGGADFSFGSTGALSMITDFAPPGSTICFGMGMEPAIEEIDVVVFPNPFSSEATLHTEQVMHNAKLAVFNSSGQQVVETINISGNKVMLRRESLASGIYFFQLMESDKIIGTGKLLVTDN